MMRPLSVALSFAVLATGSQPALSQQLASLYIGEELLPSCRLATGPDQLSGVDLVKASYCVGVVATLISMGPMLESDYRFCFPQGESTQQAMLTVVAILEQKPPVLQLDFRVLAATTMRQAWPCKP